MSGQVEVVVPVLSVRDLHASIRWYREKLGFEVDWGGETFRSRLCSVSLDGKAIMLRAEAVRTKGEVWIGGRAREVWGRLKGDTSVKFVQRLVNHPWGLDCKVEDPDGNVLWFGEEKLEGAGIGEEVD